MEEETSMRGRVKKRRRLSRRSLFLPSVPTANEIPVEQWKIIADFLPKTSRALLAVALTAPPASFRESGWKGQPNSVSTAIISDTKAGASFEFILEEIYREARAEAVAGEKLPILKRAGGPEQQDELFRQCLSKQFEEYYDGNWQILDFVDIPLSLASRLSDDDIGAILVCIDAKNNLGQLKLTHCFNVVGYGLGPLRNSEHLEKLDLGLVMEFQQPYWIEAACYPIWHEYSCHSTVKLSEEPVCDIIDSILRAEDSELVRLQYPYEWYQENHLAYKWHSKKLFNPPAAIAPVRNNQKPDPKIVPRYHNQIIRSDRMKQLVKDHNAFVNKYSCCLYFGFEDESGVCAHLSQEVEIDYVDTCLGCYESEYKSCSHCKIIICRDCSDTIGCSNCDVRYCSLCCRDNGFKNEVSYCEDEECESYCRGCRLNGCRDGSNDCAWCKGMAYDALLKECNANQVQIESHRDEIEKLQLASGDEVQTDNTEAEKNVDPLITINIIEDGDEQKRDVFVFKENRSTKLGQVFKSYASREGVDCSRLRFTLRGVLIDPNTTLEVLTLSDRVEIRCFRAMDVVLRNQFRQVTIFKLQSAHTKMNEVFRAYAMMKGVDMSRIRIKAKGGAFIHPNKVARWILNDGSLFECTVQGELLRDTCKMSQITIRSPGIYHLDYGRKPSPNAAINVWCYIADFLPKTSRALLAAALTAPSSSFRERGWRRKPNALSKAIISRTSDGSFDSVMGELFKESAKLFDGAERDGSRRVQIVMKKSLRGATRGLKFFEGLSEELEEYYDAQWDVLDFVDIPTSLASRLSDDDLGAVLVCIDAKNELKRLKLTHCINIVGHGLGPLRGSVVVEKIDLGLYRQFEQMFWPDGRKDFRNAKLSPNIVCDILESILYKEGNSFTRLQYPCKLGWLGRMPRFRAKQESWDHKHRIGTELMRFAYVHSALINNYTSSLYFGYANGKEFCSSLKDVWKCDIIDTCHHCEGANYGYCLYCNRIHCKNCVAKDDRFECYLCGIGYCQDCAGNVVGREVSICEFGIDCEPYCGDCRLSACRKGGINCNECKGMVFDTLLEECDTKQAQINSQRDEMTRLRRELGNELTAEEPI
eukprot:scaffold2436_cov80-Skeletonema_dohrnii-CCMP3373.AAC.11